MKEHRLFSYHSLLIYLKGYFFRGDVAEYTPCENLSLLCIIIIYIKIVLFGNPRCAAVADPVAPPTVSQHLNGMHSASQLHNANANKVIPFIPFMGMYP